MEGESCEVVGGGSNDDVAQKSTPCAQLVRGARGVRSFIQRLRARIERRCPSVPSTSWRSLCICPESRLRVGRRCFLRRWAKRGLFLGRKRNRIFKPAAAGAVQ